MKKKTEKELLEMLQKYSLYQILKKEPEEFTSFRDLWRALNIIVKNKKEVYKFMGLYYTILSKKELDNYFEKTDKFLMDTFLLKMPVIKKTDPLLLEHIKTNSNSSTKKIKKEVKKDLKTTDLIDPAELVVFFRDYEREPMYFFIRRIE